MNFKKLCSSSFLNLTSKLRLTKYSTSVSNKNVNSKKLEDKIKKKVQFYIQNELPDLNLENHVADLKQSIKTQVSKFFSYLSKTKQTLVIIKAENVRKLKNNPNISKEELSQAIQTLTNQQSIFRQKIEKYLQVEEKPTIDLKNLELLLKERFFYDQSFTLYGGVSGLYDLGPLGCGIQNNLLSEWQNDFVLRDKIFQVDCSILTPELVLKASGHLNKFSDIMVRDQKTKDSYRVDHLLKSEIENILKKSKDQELIDVLKKIENSQLNDLKEIDKVIEKFNIKSPKNNRLSEASQFNLMFKTEIGSHGNICFMRPETSQGIFLNFKRLYDFNQKKLPLIVAQIGKSFRNEINPKSGLIRQREFMMAEIEHFLDPVQKGSSYEKFSQVENLFVNILDEDSQLNSKFPLKIQLGEAIEKKIIKSEIIAYYIGRINEFCIKIGINENKIRFREHLSNEMAHYANECWDLECLTSFGWIECAGIADRSDFDLKKHAEFSGTDLRAERINKTKNITEQFIPHVIEPSFGIGRLMYTMLEHNFVTRSNSTKQFLSLPYQIAPYKCNILPLNESDEQLKPLVGMISDLLTENGIFHRIDDNSGSIGRRYWRSDECGIPYAITVDYDSLNDKKITIRDRDTTEQVRIKIEDITRVLLQLGKRKISWKDLL